MKYEAWVKIIPTLSKLWLNHRSGSEEARREYELKVKEMELKKQEMELEKGQLELKLERIRFEREKWEAKEEKSSDPETKREAQEKAEKYRSKESVKEQELQEIAGLLEAADEFNDAVRLGDEEKVEELMYMMM